MFEEKVYDVLIVGGGPAGLSASIYTARAGLSTILYQGELAGGNLNLTEEVDNYLGMPEMSGNDMAEAFVQHSKKFNVEHRYGKIIGIEKNELSNIFTSLDENGSAVHSKSVIYAAGSSSRKLGIVGEELSGVSYCATCDGMFYAGDKVAVIGGGNTAVEDALYLSNLAESVDVFVRSHWRADKPMVESLSAKDNVTIHMGDNVASILSNDGVEVSSIVSSNGLHIDVSGVFVAVGQNPNSNEAGENVVLFEDGFISHSQIPGFFVAGDVSEQEMRQVVIAAGEGARAGIAATRFLQI